MKELEQFYQNVLNSLPSHIAVVDRRGRIVAANRAWEQFAQETGAGTLSRASLGENYLEICRRAAKAGMEGAAEAYQGIRAVLEGAEPEFVLEYPCHCGEEKHWFRMRATPLSAGEDTDTSLPTNGKPGDRRRLSLAERERTGGTGASPVEVDVRVETDAAVEIDAAGDKPDHPGGEPQGVVLWHSEITRRKLTEEALQEAKQFGEQVVSNAVEGIVVYDRDLCTMVWNPVMEQLTGLSANEVMGKQALEVFPQFREQGIDLLLERALVGYRVTSPDTSYEAPGTGRSGWMVGTYGPIHNSSGEIVGIIGIISDISNRKQAEEQLLHDALHDKLTGLPNRALFLDRLAHVIHLARRREGYLYAVLFLDFDHFKLINDNLGHILGDQFLIAVARRLEASLRFGDTVARLGGDEFAILLEDIKSTTEATLVAERIQKTLSAPFHLQGHEVLSSASIGIALSTRGYGSPQDLLQDADMAMYRAKALGGGRHEVFDAAMHSRLAVLQQLETDLRRAIDREEFHVSYQPVVALEDGKIVGFEALVAWRHPERGPISPSEFIPIAEDTGLILPIGRWVLLEACQQMRGWKSQFPDREELTISVNLSSRQFSQPNLAMQVDQVLKEAGLDARHLKIEITESVITRNIYSAPPTLAELQSMDIGVGLDDFGTDRSSLSYLHSLPLNRLKIDRSVIAGLGVKEKSLEIVRTIVILAQGLNIEVVAEGVETREQWEILKSIHCTYGQGYFFSRPVDKVQASAMIAQGCLGRL